MYSLQWWLRTATDNLFLTVVIVAIPSTLNPTWWQSCSCSTVSKCLITFCLQEACMYCKSPISSPLSVPFLGVSKLCSLNLLLLVTFFEPITVLPTLLLAVFNARFSKTMNPKLKHGAAEGRTGPASCTKLKLVLLNVFLQTLMLLHACCLSHITFHFWGPHFCGCYPYGNVVRFRLYMVFCQTAFLFFKSVEDASSMIQPPQWAWITHSPSLMLKGLWFPKLISQVVTVLLTTVG